MKVSALQVCDWRRGGSYLVCTVPFSLIISMFWFGKAMLHWSLFQGETNIWVALRGCLLRQVVLDLDYNGKDFYDQVVAHFSSAAIQAMATFIVATFPKLEHVVDRPIADDGLGVILGTFLWQLTCGCISNELYLHTGRLLQACTAYWIKGTRRGNHRFIKLYMCLSLLHLILQIRFLATGGRRRRNDPIC